jgi:hypothetical protein
MAQLALIIKEISPLRIVKGIKEYNEEIEQLTNTAWYIVYTALWNTEQLSAKEKEIAVNAVREFLQQSNNHRKAFNEFIQRVLMARQYIICHPGTYAPIPLRWFDPSNTKGFAGTAKWFQSLEEMRESILDYKEPLKVFSSAVIETINTDSPTVFHEWRSYFITNRAQGLLNLYLSIIANYQLLNK